MITAFARTSQFFIAQAQRIQLKMLPELHVGEGALYDLVLLIQSRGFSNVMLVTTAGFVRRGIVSIIEQELQAVGVHVHVFSHVAPDPDFDCIEDAFKKFCTSQSQAIIALGGGSVMDCAKIVGALAVRPGKKVQDLVGTMKVRTALPFLIAIPTTAGTGSEATAAAVVTNTSQKRKYAVADFRLIPHAAILDPTLLAGLPPAMTAYSGMDALTHAVEAYLNRYGSHQSRLYAQRAIVLIFKHLKSSFQDGTNIYHREKMLLASYYAGIAFSNAMVGYVHALAHGIGGRYHVQHGLANAILLPHVLGQYGKSAYASLAKLERLVSLAECVDIRESDGVRHDVDDKQTTILRPLFLDDLIKKANMSQNEENDETLAKKFIERIKLLNQSFDIPDVIKELKKQDIPVLAQGALAEGNPAYPVPHIWDLSTFEQVLCSVCAEKNIG